MQGVEAGGRDVMGYRLENVTRHVDASFIIVLKMYENTLMTWVLSSETEDLEYTASVDIAERKCEFSDWMSCAAFAEWAEWQQVFAKARQTIECEEESGRPMGEDDLIRLAQVLIPDTMKGDLDADLWASIRDPRTFPEVVCSLGRPFEMLERHFCEKAEGALDELSRLLWEPILQQCPSLQESLQGDAACVKPVRALLCFA